jgi:hypothetical protein
MPENPPEDDKLADFLNSQKVEPDALQEIKQAHSKNPVKRRRFDSREQALIGLLVGGLGMIGFSLYSILTITPGPNFGARLGGLIGALIAGVIGLVVSLVFWARKGAE